MADEAPETTAETTPAEPAEKATEQTVPYERFQQANRKAKEEAEQRKALAKEVADLRTAMEERENAGLPELDRMKKEMDRLAKRAEEAERKAAEADTKLARTTKERWVIAAAKDFADPSDAVAFVDLDAIEDDKDAERAVKALAKTKKHLLKAEDPVLPGRVMESGKPIHANGQPAEKQRLAAEAEELAQGLKQFASK